MDWTDFANGLLSDGTSLANTATLGGQATVLSDITGQNYTNSFLQQFGLSGSNGSSSLLMLLLIVVVLLVVLEKQ